MIDIREHGGGLVGVKNTQGNLYVQTSQPTQNSGIWVQAESGKKKQTIKHDGIVSSGYSTFSLYHKLPYEFLSGSSVSIGEDIYFFGSIKNENTKMAYKYNTVSKSFTRLKDVPYDFGFGDAVTIGTDIYLFGGTLLRRAYKYNILTNDYVRIVDLPYDFDRGKAVAVGLDIYLFGGINTNSKQTAYKYNSITGEYFRLSDIPYGFVSGYAEEVGGFIYLFGGTENTVSSYKYDTSQDTYIKITESIPVGFANGSSTKIGTNIYLLGSYLPVSSFPSAYTLYAYRFDTLNETYKRLSDSGALNTINPLDYNHYYGDAVAVGDTIFYFGGGSLSTYSTMSAINIKKSEREYVAVVPYDCNHCNGAVVGTDVYLFGSVSTSYVNHAYRYDSLANTYTRLSDIPNSFFEGYVCSIGADIYIFGGSSSPNSAIKYDTLTDSYQKLENIPYSFTNSSGAVIGNDIYLFGSGSSGSQYNAYKYDTILGTYTRLKDVPYQFFNGGVSSVGTDIYLIGGNSSTNKFYKFDTVNQVYVLLNTLGFNFYGGSSVSYGTDIFLIGNSASGYQSSVYRYDSITGQFSTPFSMVKAFNDGYVGVVGSEFYLFVGSGTSKTTYKAIPYSNEIGEDEIIMNLLPSIKGFEKLKINNEIELHATIVGAYQRDKTRTISLNVYQHDGEKWKQIGYESP